MKNKNTSDLQQDLMTTSNLNSFLEKHQEQFINKNVSEMLNHIFTQKKVSKASLAKLSGMSEIYLHQIFAGKRTPSRNRLLCLCYGLETSLEETQNLLKCCCLAQLYPKVRRDAIIIFGIVHHIPLFEINDKLFAENEETLY